jgi:hypothetical protein
MKKLISIALVLAMVLAILPVAALAAPATGNYFVAGDTGLTGVNWVANNMANRMTKSGAVYTKVYSNLAAGDYQFKITAGNWNNSWGDNGQNYQFNNAFPCDVTITFDPATEIATITGTGVGAVVFEAESITAVGAGAGGFLNDIVWDPAASENYMTNTDGIWSIKYENVAAGAYEFKFAANATWADSWGFEGDVANDTWMDAVYNGVNANVNVDKDGSSVELMLDLSTYDAGSKTGAKMKVLVLPPAGEEITISEGTAALLSDTNGEVVEISYKPLRDGILTVAFDAANPGWAFTIEMPDGTSTLLEAGKDAAAFEQEVFAGETYKVFLYAYLPDLYSFADGSISYKVSFHTANVNHDAAKEEYLIADGALVLGNNNVTILENALNTLYEFAPTETGVYTFTAPEGVKIGNWNTPFSPNDQSGDNKTNVVEWTCTAVGQPVLIGITEATTITVVKKGDAEIQEEIDYETYVNVHTPSENQLINLDEKEPTPVDITKPQTVVRDEDGLYHLGTVDGPLLFVNLSNEGIDFMQGFFGGYGAHAMRGAYNDDGIIKHYDFKEAMREYAEVIYNADTDNCLYPLTDDLAIFLKAYGGNQGWFKPEQTPYEAIRGEHNADSAWLVICCYLEDVTSGGEVEDPTPSPDTADMSMVPVAIVMVLVVAGIVALVPAKKKFF